MILASLAACELKYLARVSRAFGYRQASSCFTLRRLLLREVITARAAEDAPTSPCDPNDVIPHHLKASLGMCLPSSSGGDSIRDESPSPSDCNFGGSWHSSDDGPQICSDRQQDDCASEADFELRERFDWLCRYWSTDEGYNTKLVEEANRLYPAAAHEPIPSSLSLDAENDEDDDEDEWAFGTPSWAA